MLHQLSVHDWCCFNLLRTQPANRLELEVLERPCRVVSVTLKALVAGWPYCASLLFSKPQTGLLNGKLF